ncbi:hypothetical protein [Microvirga massiliensis]|uniref:hypothetical protein n=1 Tax=Microvirga massiliensis TaxID=1033741 RepID=UPI000ABE6F64
MERAGLLWRASQGETAPDLAARFHHTAATVRRRLHRFNHMEWTRPGSLVSAHSDT